LLPSGSCEDTYSVVREWIATDNCGNSSIATQTIEVGDNTPPLLVGVPTDLTVECDAIPAAPSAGTVSATDNCDVNVEITFDESIENSGTCPDAYTIVRTWIATDNCGNTAQQEQRIEVGDNTPPVLVGIPADVSTECGQIPDVPVGSVQATDNCDSDVDIEYEEMTVPGPCQDTYTIIRSWLATDECGNTDSAEQRIEVGDTVDPILTNIPNDVTVECGEVPNPPAIGEVFATDNCDQDVDLEFIENTVAGACDDAFAIVRTWTATDNCGNSAVAEQRIEVGDSTPPVLAGIPADVTSECDSVDPINGSGGVTVTDNCDSNVTLELDEQTIPGDCEGAYTLVRTWLATDNCGNTAVGEQRVEVGDSTPPVLSGSPSDATISCGENPPTAETITATDNCDTNVDLEFDEVSTAGQVDCTDSYEITRTWTATDDCGNTAQVIQVITVTGDDTPPTLTGVPADEVVECGEVPNPNVGQVQASDDCDPNVDIQFEETEEPGACANAYTVVRRWIATDDCGNSSVAEQRISVGDTTEPAIAGVPADLTIDCGALPPTPANPTATDNCDTNVDLAFDEQSTAGTVDCTDSYEITRTWTATDDCGNTAQTIQIITVSGDDTAPTLVGVPADVSTECGEIPDVPVGQVQATDNCDPNVDVTYDSVEVPGSCENTYTIIRTWIATDECGNSTAAEQRIEVGDTTPPMITGAPQDETIDCGDTPSDAPTLFATDNCDANVQLEFEETTSQGSVDCTDSYTITRTWSAVDACGNSASVNQTITVAGDGTPPIISGVPADEVVECGEVPNPNVGQVQASDDCDPNVDIQFEETEEPGACEDAYTVVRRWIATDDCGNSSVAEQRISVGDTTDPAIAGVPADLTIDCGDIPPTPANPTATDNCDTNVDLAYDEQSTAGTVDCTDSYEITRTWTATDDCGNTAQAIQIITVSGDDTPPTLVGVPADVSTECGEIPDVPVGQVQATDNCDPNVDVTYDSVEVPGNCENTYTIVRTWIATDECGNSTAAEQRIEVGDTTPPMITGAPQDETIDCGDTPSDAPTLSATDNCDANVQLEFEETTSQGSVDCTDSYTITRTWSAVDACGNSALVTQTITVAGDGTPPVITGVPSDEEVACGEVPNPSVGLVQASDDCDPNVDLQFEETEEPGACANAYTVVRTWIATDDCGNSTVAEQRISVGDALAPSIAGVPADMTIDCGDVPPNPANPTATDNCDTNVDLAFDEQSTAGNVDCTDSYEITRTWTATDDCGNTVQSVQVITVSGDATAPTLVGVPADVSTECGEIPDVPVGQVQATDNCDPNVEVTYDSVEMPGLCENAYTIIRTWIATDDCGNTAIGEQRIEVGDTTPPMISGAPQDETIDCGDAPSDAPNLFVTDNCDPNVQLVFDETVSQGNADCTDSYSIIREWSAVDGCGNSAVFTQTITVSGDGTAPTLVGVPADVSTECGEIPDVPVGQVQATDDCDPDVDIDYTETTIPGNCAEAYTLVRTWIATDDCGNTAIGEQRIEVGDTTPPMLSGNAPDVTIDCGDTPPNEPNITATDNCDSNVQVNYDETTSQGTVDCQSSYTITRTWTATDACGNTATLDQTVTVAGDATPPVLAGIPADEDVACGGVPNVPNGQVTASDDCDPDVDVTMEETIEAGACANAYTLVRTWIAIDDCGNSAVGEQRITVGDAIAPVLSSAPSDMTIDCGDTPPAAANLTATDNCDANIDVVFDEIQTTGNVDCQSSYTITRIWMATDACGNSATAEQVITIAGDATPPTLVGVPEDVISDCGSIPDVGVSPVTATDACDPNVEVVMSERTIPGDCAGAYDIIRTWTAIDDCGNSAVGEMRIQVADTEAPTIVGVPADENLDCNGSTNIEMPNVVAVDNCDANMNVVFNEEKIDSQCEGSYTLVRTWTATDGCGNQTVETQTISIGDDGPPTLAATPADVTIQCGEEPELEPFIQATDACDDDVEVIFEEQIGLGSGDCQASFEIVRTWTAVDDCGNSAISQQIITVTGDDVAPQLVGVPDDIATECGTIPDVGLTPVTANDNCDTNVDVAMTERTEPGQCGDNYVIIRTWTATDACGNTAIGEQRIEVGDTTPPMLSGIPDNEEIDCDGNADVPLPNVIATDNCDTDVQIDFNEETIDSNCPGSYTLVRTWTATDACGNSATAEQRINVGDNGAPYFTNIPPDMDIDCGGLPEGLAPTANDDCGEVTVEADEVTNPGDCENNYQIVRTWVATDDCGNSASVSQTINISDVNAPIITGVGADVIVDGADQIPAVGNVVVTDNCDQDPQLEFEETQTEGCEFEITRTWTATDACGNTATAYQIITIEGDLSISLSPLDAEVCAGEAVTFAVTPNDASFTYTWTTTGGTFDDPTSASPNFTATEDGTYQISVSVAAEGCSDEATATVTVGGALTPTVVSNGPICEGETLELTATGGTTYTWTGPNGFTATGDVVTIPAAVASDHQGTYTVSVANASGCEGTATIEAVIERVPNPALTSNGPICQGSTLNLTADGGVTYAWTGPNGYTSNEQNPTIDAVDLNPGTYTYTVEVETLAGCSATANIEVVVTEGTLVSIIDDFTICEDENINLAVTGGASWSWTGPAGFSSVEQNPSITNASLDMSGTYTVLITDDNRCESTASVNVTVEECACELDAIVSFQQDENCDDENGVAVLVPSLLTYTWSDGGSGSVREDLADGTYMVTVSDGAGCTEELTVVINEVGNCNSCIEPQVTNIIVMDASCEEQNGMVTIELGEDPSNYTYTWTPNIGNSLGDGNVRDGLFGGTYSVIVTDPEFADCFIKVDIAVENIDGPNVTKVDVTPALCGETNGIVELSPDNYIYTWTHDSGSGAVRDDLAAGTYQVAVMDLNVPTCPTVVTVEVPGTNSLEVEVVVVEKPSCGEANGAVTINTLSQGNGALSYEWSAGGEGLNRNGLAAGTYSVTVIDAQGCIQELVFTLADDVAAAVVEIDSEFSTSCPGSNDAVIDYEVVLTNGFVGPAEETIVDALGFTYVNGSLHPGSYCVVVKDANGCIAGEGCFDVVEPGQITFEIASSDATCDAGGTIDLTVTGGNGNFSYNWSDLPGTGNFEDRTDLEEGMYSVTITDTEGCTASMSDIQITTDCRPGCEMPEIVPEITNASCDGTAGEISLAIAADPTLFTYAWTPLVSTTQDAFGLDAGTYEVTISTIGDENCNTALSFVIENTDGPQATVSSNVAATCDEGGAVTLTPATYTYEWSDGAEGAERTGLTPGLYTITIVDGNTTCENVISVEVENNCGTQECAQMPTLQAATTDATCGEENGAIILTIDGLGTQYLYTWSPDVSTSSSASGLAAGTYNITAVDVDNPSCRVSDVVVIGNTDGPLAQVNTSGIASCEESNGFATLIPSVLDYAWSDGGSGDERNDLSADAYTITATDSDGCVTILELEIGDDCSVCETPEIANVNVIDASCGNNTGSIEIELLTNGAYAYTWDPMISNSDEALDLEAGSYAVTVSSVTDPTCATEMVIVVGNTDGPESSVFELTAATCFNDGAAELIPSNYQYTWSDGGSGAERNDLKAGDYQVTVTDVATGCINVVDFTILFDCHVEPCDNPVVLTVNTQDATCGNSNGIAELIMAATGDYVYTWDPEVSFNETANGIPAGSYLVTVAQAADVLCFTEVDVVIGNSDGPQASVVDFSVETCEDFGSAELAPANYTYTWNDLGTGNSRDDLEAGLYFITVTDPATGCIDVLELNIIKECDPFNCTAPVISSVDVTDATCGNENGSASLSVEGIEDYTYTWSHGGVNAPTVANLGAGTYTVTVSLTALPDCQSETTFVVGNADGPVATIGNQTNEDCDGLGAALLNPSTYTYEWSDNGTGNERDDLAEGTYQVTVTDPVTDCIDLLEVVIANDCTVNPCTDPVIVNVDVTESTCGNENGAIALTLDQDQNYEFVWSPSMSTISSASNLPAGSYEVTISVVDHPECNIETSILVGNTDGPQAEVVRNNAADCDVDGSAEISPDTFDYTWSDNGSGNVRLDLAAGQYFVTVTDPATGCIDVIELIIADDCEAVSCETPTISSVDLVDATCGNADGSAAVVVSGNETYDYAWSNGAANGASISDLEAGTYTVTVSLPNLPDCQSESTFVIGNSDGPDANIAAQTEANCDDLGTVTLTPATYTYDWSDNGSGDVRDDLAGGTYQVTVTDPATGCIDLLEVVIIYDCPSNPCNDPVIVDINITDATCGNADGIVEIMTDDTQEYDFNWSPSLSSINTATNLTAGTYEVTISVVGNTSCATETTIIVGNANGPTAEVLSNTPATCTTDGSVELSPTTYSYDWSDNGNGTIRTDLNGGEYQVTVTDPTTGCIDVLSIVVADECVDVACDKPVVNNLIIFDSSCDENTGVVSVDVGGLGADFEYIWTPDVGIPNLDGSVRNDVPAGVYTMRIQRVGEPTCFTEVNFAVSNTDGPEITSFGIIPSACDGANGETALMPAEYTYTWADGTIGGERNDLAPGTYEVTVVADGAEDCPTFVIVEIPAFNTLVAGVDIQEASCGNADGVATVTILEGGSGSYSYVWAGGYSSTEAVRTDLASGAYSVTVFDDNTACQSEITFTITDEVAAGATIAIEEEVILLQCANMEDGTVVYDITYDDGFVEPATVQIQAVDGLVYENGALSADGYCVQVIDGNGCLAAESCFMVINPNAIDVEVIKIDATCENGGSIFMNVSGGTGSFTFDWADIPGDDNGEERTELSAGIYSVTIIDANGCEVVADGIQILDDCNGGGLMIDTLAVTTPELTPIEVCIDTTQLNGSFAELVLCANPATGSVEITADGCVIYTPDAAMEIGDMDEFCVTICDENGDCIQTIVFVTLTPVCENGINIFEDEDLVIEVENCTDNASYCLDIDLDAINDYQFTDNNQLYTNLGGCDFDSAFMYTYFTIPDQAENGPYTLDEWSVNGTTFSGDFNTVQELVDLMNEWDPIGNWTIDETAFMINGGSTGNLYGDMTISQPASNATTIINLNGVLVPNAVGLRLEVGTHSIIATEINTGCKDTIDIVVFCNDDSVMTTPDTIDIVIPVGTDTLYCFDNSELTDEIVTVINDCEEEGVGAVEYEVVGDCILIDGVVIGEDIGCFIFCDGNGVCDTVVIFTEVVPEGGITPPVAVDDYSTTVVDVTINSYNLLENDTIGSETVTVQILSDPLFGTVILNDDNTIDYIPNPGECGQQDEFTYMITTASGSSIANVYIDILCEPITVYNGFSPNGDGVNDTFTILGIEMFPDNEVIIFNRWGNQVYYTRGYTNDNGWGGSWEGKLLPDGTYFYIVHDGLGGTYSGYVQIQR